jgi:hypothetical protein
MTNLILHGAYAQQSDLATPAEFDRLTGVAETLIHVSFTMQAGAATFQPFPQALLSAYWLKRQLTLLTWGTWDYTSGHAFSWADIVSGKYDPQLHVWAKAAAAWAHPFFLRFDHEMNGNWSNLPYTLLAFADPAGYVAAWRHVVDLFRSDGATNVTWVWCINSVTPPGTGKSTDADKLTSLYPGDGYVDWTGFDAYNWAGSKPGTPWLSWQQVVSGYSNWIGDTYGALLAVAPSKPILVGEFGCEKTGGPTGKTPNGDKTAWILDALKTTPTLYPQIGALSYFHRSYTPTPSWALDGYDGMSWKAGVAGLAYVQPGFLLPADLQPIQPYRLAAVSGSGQSAADQTAALVATRAALAIATTSQATTQTELDQAKSDVAAVIRLGTPATPTEPVP